MTLSEKLPPLESSLSALAAERNSGPIQNDVYEAIHDWCFLGQGAAAGDTRVNYPARTRGELLLLEKLRSLLCTRPETERVRYSCLLDRAEDLLREIGDVPLPSEGHLGVLRIIRRYFDFLLDEYAFTVVDEQPTQMRLESGTVTIELGWASQASLSFSLIKAECRIFWIEDLLFLHGDQRYESVPQAIQLNTESDVDEWFRFIASVMRQYGNELLRDKPGASERLAEAQTKRDGEFVAMMNEKYGKK